MKPVFGSPLDSLKPRDQAEEKILQRIGAWTVKLFEYRARTQGLIPYESILEESARKFGHPMADTLISLRKKHGMTQKELSEKSGVSQSAISKIESGQKPISPAEAKALAPVLKCSVKYLAIGKK